MFEEAATFALKADSISDTLNQWQRGTNRGLDIYAIAFIDARSSMFIPGNLRQKVSRKSSLKRSGLQKLDNVM